MKKKLPAELKITDTDFHDFKLELYPDTVEVSTPSYPYVVALTPKDMRRVARWLNAQARIMEQRNAKEIAWNRSLNGKGPSVWISYPGALASIQNWTEKEKFKMIDWNLPQNKIALREAKKKV